MREILNDEQRTTLAGLLVELDITEIHKELNRAIDNHDKEKALYISGVKESITKILGYLEK